MVLVDDGRGEDDPLHLIVEIKGFRGEDAKEKKTTVDTYWIPGVNHLGAFGRWAFTELTDVHQIESGFKRIIAGPPTRSGMKATRYGHDGFREVAVHSGEVLPTPSGGNPLHHAFPDRRFQRDGP